jgi:hypothetical protein
VAEPDVRLELDGDAVMVLDDVINHWLVRVEPASFTDRPTGATTAMAGTVVAALLDVVPDLRRRAPESGGLRVVFSSEARRALLTGRYRLMSSATGALPVAVNAATGATAEIARVAPNTAVGVGSGIALAATAAELWPIVLAAGVATAAAWAEQRWLERTFGDLQASLQRVEARLRDDDHGAIDAADRLVELLAADLDDSVAPPLAAELGVARQAVERVYWARRRFVQRFAASLEERQDAHERKTGERHAWAGPTAAELADATTGVTDELVVFVSAMISRARATAVTASVLAADGHPLAALRLVDGLEESLRDDYGDLYRRLRALAREPATTARWKRLVPLFDDDEDAEKAHRMVSWLSAQMDRTIGAALPQRDEPLALVVPLRAA